MDHLTHKDLTPGQNNVWYEYNDSEDVVVFVHGFFSESAGAWLYENKLDHTKDQFWPDLIRSDARLANPSLFLGGYHSTLDSGNYGFDNCADELFSALQRQDEQGHPPVMEKPGIVFVCHSMGGIVVRYVLERHREAFASKRVGLVLIASPSYGSAHADRLAWLAALYNQEQGLHLKWGDALLQDLDSRFKDLVDSRTIRDLVGVEACENYFILHRKWFPDKSIVVTEESAGRYFGAAKMLRGTNHFTAIKPNGLRHPTHELIVDFWRRYNFLKSQGPQDDPAAASPAGPPSPSSTILAGQDGASLPLPSEETRHSNLPAQVNSFVGREGTVEQVKTFLGTSRLVTLTGPGGVGKSRLALQVAGEVDEQYADGVWLVELAALSDPDLVIQAVASVLGVREVAGAALAQTLATQLRPRTLLLVLDNCEHLLEACGRLCDGLLSACSQVRVLATSRERLGITGEQAFPVPSLVTPDPTALPPFDNLTQMEAVKLFQDRAAAAELSFSITPENASAVAQVCWRLDGIPLAIELAAARVASLTVQQIADRLGDRFHLLTGGSRMALPRQQTLRALVEWSYDLLSDREKTVFQRLAVFVGGWTLEAAEAVCGDGGIDPRDVLNLLGSLSDKSLVVSDLKGDAVRYRMLETIRLYAQERCQEASEQTTARSRLLEWCRRLTEEAAPKLVGPDQKWWLSRLEAEHDNFREVLSWPQGGMVEEEERLALIRGLSRLWYVRGYFTEGRRIIDTVLRETAAAELSAARAEVLDWAGTLASTQGALGMARQHHGEALIVFTKLNDQYGIASSLGGLGNVAFNEGNFIEARERYETACEMLEGLGDQRGVANSLNNLGNVAAREGNYDEARVQIERALAISRGLGDHQSTAHSLMSFGVLAQFMSEDTQARTRYTQALEVFSSLGDQRGVAGALSNLASIPLPKGDPAEALDQLERALTASEALGDRQGVASCLGNMGNLAKEQGDYDTAQGLYERALSELLDLRSQDQIAGTLSNLGNIASDKGDYRTAEGRYSEALELFRAQGSEKRGFATTLSNLATTLHRRGELLRARELYLESLIIARQLGDQQVIFASLGNLATLACDQGQVLRALRLDGAVQALRVSGGNPVKLSDQEKYEHTKSVGNAVLGEDGTALVWSEGRAMTLEQAVEYALGEDRPEPPSATPSLNP